MFFRRKVIAVVSSLMFLPVSFAVGTIPAAHVASHASTRDLAAGEPPHHPPVGIPLVEKAMPGAAVVFDADRVPDALDRWPGLTPRLPPVGGTPYGDDDRVEWRVLSAERDAQRIEVRWITKRATRFVRYRATDAGVTLLSSRMFTRAHAWTGAGVGVVFAAVVLWGARRMRRALPDEPPPRAPGARRDR